MPESDFEFQPLTVYVDTVEWGVPGDAGHCPIANAMRFDPDVWAPKAKTSTIEYSRISTGERYIHNYPPEVRRFYTRFDEWGKGLRAKPPKSFSFTLDETTLKRVAR